MQGTVFQQEREDWVGYKSKAAKSAVSKAKLRKYYEIVWEVRNKRYVQDG